MCADRHRIATGPEAFGLCAHCRLVKEPAALDLASKENVFLNGQLLGQIKFLMDQDDAMVFTDFTVGKFDRRTIQDQFAAAWLMVARQDFHECGFARAIFTKKRMHFARTQVD